MEQNIFDKLKQLQEILYKKFQVENEIVEIPKALSTKNEMVTRLKKSYIDKNKYIVRKESRLEQLNLELSQIESGRQQYEEQMDIIETQREYEILDKQIKDANEQEQKIRKDIKKEEFEMNELQETLKRSELLIQQNETELAEEKERIEGLLDEKREELKVLEQEKDQIIPGMDEELLFKFDRIIRNKEGRGIVPINDQICTGCHMQLPAQFANDIRGGKEIQFCPYCSRILYFEQIEDVQEDFAFSDADAGGLTDLVDMSDFDDI